MKSNLPIIGKILAVVISVLCIAFMAILHFSDKDSRAETEAVVEEVNEGTRAEEKTQSVQAAAAKAAREKTDSFYQKRRTDLVRTPCAGASQHLRDPGRDG